LPKLNKHDPVALMGKAEREAHEAKHCPLFNMSVGEVNAYMDLHVNDLDDVKGVLKDILAHIAACKSDK
jgi:hypothetical protein